MLSTGMLVLPLNPTLTTIAPPTPDGGWLDKQNLSQIARSLEEELLLCSADSRLVASSLLWAVSHRFLIQESDILRRKEKELAWGHTVSRRNKFPHNFQRSSIRRNAWIVVDDAFDDFHLLFQAKVHCIYVVLC
jgi:hypothetical protein